MFKKIENHGVVIQFHIRKSQSLKELQSTKSNPNEISSGRNFKPVGTNFHGTNVASNCASWRTQCCVKGTVPAYDLLANVAKRPEDIE